MATPLTAETLRDSYRAIFVYQNDSPADRENWHAASNDERLAASDQVHAGDDAPNRYRLMWGLAA